VIDEPLPPMCATYTRAFDIIGRRWTGPILRALMSGHTRFTSLARSIPGLSDRLLSERLKELEGEGLVVRTVTPSTPVRIEYTLSEMGAALLPALVAVEQWAQTWLAPAERTA
jgi:DNA-binding HxlR family transcriptional regulator